MHKILLALMLVSGFAVAAQADDWRTDGPPPAARFARLQNLTAPPADSTYSLGGYAPADPNMNVNGNPGLIDKSELDSPPGSCGGLWDGYVARPCHHQHHFGMGGGCGCGQGRTGWGHGVCGGGCNSGCATGGCATGSCGGGWGGWGGLGGGGGCGCATQSCAPACRPRHHCPLFGCFKKSSCCDVASTCESCGCGATTDSTQPMPTNDNAPRPETLEPEAAPTPAPGPAPEKTTNQRQPRVLKSMAALSGMFSN